MKPLRAATHKPLAFETLAKLGNSIEEIAEDGMVDTEALLDLASELGVGAERLWAALPNTEIRLKTTETIKFEVCVGGCQGWGALDVVERLLDVRDERADDDGTLFDVIPRSCLDKCQGASVVVIDTGDGRAVIDKATPSKIDEALQDL